MVALIEGTEAADFKDKSPQGKQYSLRGALKIVHLWLITNFKIVYTL